MAEMDSASGLGLREFLDWAGSKGELNPTTAKALKGAVGKILEIEDDPSNVDIRSLDVESTLSRFEMLNRTGYSSGSMSTYKTRFRQAVNMYLAWLDKDPRWKTVVKSRRTSDSARRRSSTSSDVAAPVLALPPSRAIVAEQVGPAETSSRLVTYHLPLRRDLLVQIQLPVHLTPADADRIAAFVKSLAFDDSSSANTTDDRGSGLEGDEEGGA